MLTEKENEFLTYWEQNRQRQKKWLYQLAFGLPFGGLLAVIILLNFFSGWYQRAEMIANSSFNPNVIYVAAIGIAVFMALFSKKFQWDQQEKRYLELQAKKKKYDLESDNGAANVAPEESTQAITER